MRVYLDNAATTLIDENIESFLGYWEVQYKGNPSSLHKDGQIAKIAIDKARNKIANLLTVLPEEIIFTSGGTESNNLALKGIFDVYSIGPQHLIISCIEHPSIMETAAYLEKRGVFVSRISVNDIGIVNLEELENSIKPYTKLISIMSANNVTGVTQPIMQIGDIARRFNIPFHTDAVQSIGYMKYNFSRMPIDMMSISSHKFYGPKGVGILYKKKSINLIPLLHGGGQENNFRSSTENVSSILGTAMALGLVYNNLLENNSKLIDYRNYIIDRLSNEIPNFYLIGSVNNRLPNHICCGVDGLEGKAIMILKYMDDKGFSISSGSACSSSHINEPSSVLTAMGYDAIKARGSIRISMSKYTNKDDIELFCDEFVKTIKELS